MRIGLYGALCILVGCGTPHDVHFTAKVWTPELADGLARSAGVPALSTAEQPELRIWGVPSIGNIDGFIVSSHRAMRCDFRSQGGPNGSIAVDRVTCAPTFISAAKRQALWALMPNLAKLNGQAWGCALGGSGVMVQGVTSGQQFFFSTSNPSFCSDERSRLVVELLHETD
jgi:hypothetical protein